VHRAAHVCRTTATTVKKDTSLRLMAFDVQSGQPSLDVEVFKVSGTALQNPKNRQASTAPIVEGDRVYVHFGAQGTAALSTAGAILWKTQLPYESQHGNGGAARLAGQHII